MISIEKILADLWDSGSPISLSIFPFIDIQMFSKWQECLMENSLVKVYISSTGSQKNIITETFFKWFPSSIGFGWKTCSIDGGKKVIIIPL